MQPLSGIKILIVDDALINQRILARMVESIGCSYQIANNGQEAIKKNNVSVFNIILMDVSMPVMDGLTATRKIRAREKELGLSVVPIIGLSGNTNVAQIKEAKEAGMVDYLPKPYLKEDILRVIKHYSDNAGHIQETKPALSDSPLSRVPALELGLKASDAVAMEAQMISRNSTPGALSASADPSRLMLSLSDDTKVESTVSQAADTVAIVKSSEQISRVPSTLFAARSDIKKSEVSVPSPGDEKKLSTMVTLPMAQSNTRQLKEDGCWYSCWNSVAHFFIAVRDCNNKGSSKVEVIADTKQAEPLGHPKIP